MLTKVQFKDWIFKIGDDEGRMYLQVQFRAACSTTSEVMDWAGRKWFLSPYMTDSELIGTAFKAVMTAVEHEAREEFRYKGRAIFGPHIGVQALWEVANQLDVRK